MRQKADPVLASLPKHRRNGDGCYGTKARGLDVLNSPLLNKGTAFTAEERKALGLTGLLPPDISTLGTQVKRAYIQYERLPDALSAASIRLVHLQPVNPTLEDVFIQLLEENHDDQPADD